MTQQQYEEAIAILAKDCEIAGQYIDNNGCTCALGALALAAGCDKKTLIAAGSCGIGAALECSPYWSAEEPHVEAIAKAIEEKFGLPIEFQKSIQWANDSVRLAGNTPLRRERVLARFDGLTKP